MVEVNEVDVVGGPADHEYEDDEGEHLDNLLLVVPTLGHRGLGHQQSQGGLVSSPKVTTHLISSSSVLLRVRGGYLNIAEPHAQNW